MEGHLQLLIVSLCLPIGLGVIASCETNSGSEGGAKGFSYLGYELRSSVRHNIRRYAVVTENMMQKDVGGLHGSGYLRQGNEVCSFGEAINSCEDDCVTLRGRQTGHKIQGNMEPGLTGNR